MSRELKDRMPPELNGLDVNVLATVRALYEESLGNPAAGEIRNRRLGYDGVKPITRIGRNEPCPCRRGKKFKHCCLRKRDATKQT